MHSRFWTFCAVANIFLFLVTLSVIYFKKDNYQRLHVSLYHRSVVGWSDGGNKIWRTFYESDFDNQTYQNFLAQGLEAVGCDHLLRAPICNCLALAHEKGNTHCTTAAYEAVKNCFMNVRPVVNVDELDRHLNPYSLLNSLNLWGMLGSVVLWIRMYICKDDASLPYSIQLILGIFAAIIHCSVLEPGISSYITYLVLVGLMSFLSYYHRYDRNWWLSMYMLQYAFTVPNMALLAFVGSQKRDMLYVITGSMLSVAYGLTAFGRALIDDTQDEGNEARGARNVTRAALVFILIVLTMAAYDEGGQFYMRSANTTSLANGFTLVLMFYLFLGLLCPSNLKRVCFADFAIRFLVSMLLQSELVMTPDLVAQ